MENEEALKEWKQNDPFLLDLEGFEAFLKEKAEEKTVLKVGDVFYASWGYDQTNIDFAKVVKISKTGKTVNCRMVSQSIEEATGFLSETVIPNREHGKTFRLCVRQHSKTEPPCLVGSYPFCGDDSKRRGAFLKWNGKALHQSHYH